MRSATHRADFLTTQQARIVAMTTTHAGERGDGRRLARFDLARARQPFVAPS